MSGWEHYVSDRTKKSATLVSRDEREGHQPAGSIDNRLVVIYTGLHGPASRLADLHCLNWQVFLLLYTIQARSAIESGGARKVSKMVPRSSIAKRYTFGTAEAVAAISHCRSLDSNFRAANAVGLRRWVQRYQCQCQFFAAVPPLRQNLASKAVEHLEMRALELRNPQAAPEAFQNSGLSENF
jgi:hypothetical protein